MFDISQYPQADAVRRAAQLSQDEYKRLYKESIEHPSAFWAEQATRFLDSVSYTHLTLPTKA